VNRFTRLAPPVLLALLAAAGCGKEIGDECSTSADCDPNGTRACDLSQPGGYCTVLGCDESSCPGGSVCIRYFPVQFLSKVCNPACEDLPSCYTGACPSSDPQCVMCPAACPQATHDCAPDEVCLDVELCARRSLERRDCEKSCGSNGDCRDGYECRLAGIHGSMLLSSDPNATAHYCAPSGSP
jgi:hypothetical protein